MTLSPEDLNELAETYAHERLNASNQEDSEAAEIMCELIRLAQIGLNPPLSVGDAEALALMGGGWSNSSHKGGANGSH